MRKHLSVLALAARGTVWRVLTVTLLSAVLSGALLWLVPAQEPGAVIVEPDGTETPQYVLVSCPGRPAQPSPVPWALPPCWRC